MIKFDYNTMSKNPKMGYYLVKDKIFWDKASSLLEASRLNLKHSDIKWVFNDEIFGKYDWTVEPEGHLRDLYHRRAKQLRDQYDYIILNFSGGSDSTTALYSFTQQNLFIDEVVIRNPEAATKKYGIDKLNLSAYNEFSEFELAAKPILKWLETVSPKTKITFHDFSLDIISDNINWDENFFHWTGDYLNPGCIVRYTHNSISEHLHMFDKGKKIAVILGIDKPRVICQNEDINFYFIDRAVHSAIPATVNNGFTNVNVELFYWSPDLPELIIKQCHEIKRWFEQPVNKNLIYMMNHWWQINPANRQTYESIVKSIIYPDYDLKTWQVNKTAASAIHTEWDFWMKDYKNTSGYKTFMRGIEYLYNNVDKDFMKLCALSKAPGTEFNMTNWEFKPYGSKLYYIGKIQK